MTKWLTCRREREKALFPLPASGEPLKRVASGPLVAPVGFR
jgi:hypothetical protein